MPNNPPLHSLKNLGLASEKMLHRAGIETYFQLQHLGAVVAYQQVVDSGQKPSLNLLYALAGALLDCHWNHLPDGERQRLLIELDSLQQWVAQKEKADPKVG